MDRVLVALEANEESRHIWKVAEQVAKQIDASVSILSVVRPALEVYADLDFTPLAEYSSSWLSGEIKARTETLRRDIGPDADLLVVEGSPADLIEQKCKSLNAKLIVMGVHNRSGLSRLLGSTTQAVLNNTDVDLLAVHPDGSSPNESGYQQIMICLDTSTDLDNICDQTKKMLCSEANYTFLSVITPLSSFFPGESIGANMSVSYQDLMNRLQTQTLAQLRSGIEHAGLDPSKLELRLGDPRHEIVQAAKDSQADLIIMSARQRGAFSRLVLGSTTQGVLNTTPCDVYVTRQT
ncbi:MAG: universal stress protein [Gammaproteobacteria bacterium]|nr:universal stress protein [Gammaproteobacteria bacterium]